MWFSLFSTVLILAITFYQGLQGLFTALINCILAMISAAVAFGFYENVYYSFLVDRQPDYGRAIALLGLFIITLLVLRTIFDIVVKDNVHFPVYVDRAGGGIFGFFVAMIVVGMLIIGFQMLPFPPGFMGFSQFRMVNKETNEPIEWPSNAKPDKNNPNPPPSAPPIDFSKVRLVRQNTWLNSAGFASSLASHLASSSLRGRQDTTFAEIHPDFPAEIHFAKANPLGASRLTAKAGSLDVVGYWDLLAGELYTREIKEQNGKQIAKLVKAESVESGLKDIAVRVKVSDAKDEGGETVRFTPEQVRLFVRSGAGGTLKPYTLIGINDDVPITQNKLVQVNPGEPIARADNTQMDFVFRVPDKADAAPEFIEFKQDARAEISVSKDMSKKRPLAIGAKAGKPVKGGVTPQVTPSNDESGSGSGTNQGGNSTNTIRPGTPTNRSYDNGRVAVLGPAQELSVSDQLPFSAPLTNYGGQTDVRGNVIKGSHDLVAPLGADWQPVAGNQPALEKFDVPADKRLLHISVERLQAGSTYGKALQFARENVEDFYLNDERGTQFRPVGLYAMATVSGKKTFELIYLDDTERDFARLPKMNHIHSADLQGQYALVYLFIVPPGTKPKEVHTGGHPVDLTQFKMEVR